jgi:branched-chain amino acid aminotransferase
MAPYQPVPAEVLARGAYVAIESAMSRAEPRIKTTRWVIERRVCADRNPDAYEHLLVDDGRILEGISSNFYGVRDGRILTAGQDVLEGITRNIVYRLAEAAGLPIDRDGLHTDDLPSLDEAFLTSSTREVVPVTRVEAVAIGSGEPGPVTLGLARAYRDYATEHARPALHLPLPTACPNTST